MNIILVAMSLLASVEVAPPRLTYSSEKVWTHEDMFSKNRRDQIIREILYIDDLVIENGTFPEGKVFVKWQSGMERPVHFVDELEILIDDNWDMREFQVILKHPVEYFPFRGPSFIHSYAAFYSGLWFDDIDSAKRHYMTTHGNVNEFHTKDLFLAGYFIGEHPNYLQGAKNSPPTALSMGIEGWIKLIQSNRDTSILVLCVVLAAVALPLYFKFQKGISNGGKDQESGSELQPPESEERQEVQSEDCEIRI